MAVYTELSNRELNAFVAGYDIGAVVSLIGIAEGVENSNFLLLTESGRYILTIYEKRVRPEDLPFFLDLMVHLSGKGFSCPMPVATRAGAMLNQLAGKPAAMVSFLTGVWPRRIWPEHCRALGRTLADLHVLAADFPGARPNDLSLPEWRELAHRIGHGAEEVKPGLTAEVTAELAALTEQWPDRLPAGIIHADLFPDNVFFEDDRVSGVIDFYFACNDFYAYDIAVCMNAWCFEPDGAFNITKARHLLTGYNDRRRLGAEEVASLPILCRGAAMRFLLTRLYDWLNTPEGVLVRPKNPLEYFDKLCFHRQVSGAGEYGLDAA